MLHFIRNFRHAMNHGENLIFKTNRLSLFLGLSLILFLQTCLKIQPSFGQQQVATPSRPQPQAQVPRLRFLRGAPPSLGGGAFAQGLLAPHDPSMVPFAGGIAFTISSQGVYPLGDPQATAGFLFDETLINALGLGVMGPQTVRSTTGSVSSETETSAAAMPLQGFLKAGIGYFNLLSGHLCLYLPIFLVADGMGSFSIPSDPGPSFPTQFQIGGRFEPGLLIVPLDDDSTTERRSNMVIISGVMGVHELINGGFTPSGAPSATAVDLGLALRLFREHVIPLSGRPSETLLRRPVFAGSLEIVRNYFLEGGAPGVSMRGLASIYLTPRVSLQLFTSINHNLDSLWDLRGILSLNWSI